jgi:hypothetical protein
MFQKYFVKLTSEDRSYFEKLVSSGEAPARKLQRGRTVWTYEAICDAFDVDTVTVTNIRKAFSEEGLEQALNRKQPEREYERRLD